MYTITLNEIRQEKNPNTKTTYLTVYNTVEVISEQQYNNYINSIPFFRRLGGSETVVRAYTCAGYKVYKLTSKSPDKQTKVIREFKFKWDDNPALNTTYQKFENLSLMGKYNYLQRNNNLTNEIETLFKGYKSNKVNFEKLHELMDKQNS
jgi:hypothetical protein